MNKIIRIGNGQGFWGDSIDAPVNLIKSGNLDYLTLDYLAEVTMAIMQKQRNKNPHMGYASDFVDFILNPYLRGSAKNRKCMNRRSKCERVEHAQTHQKRLLIRSIASPYLGF